MNWLGALSGGNLYIEIRQRSLRVLQGEENLLIPIERQPAGRLTAHSREAACQALRAFLKKKNWQTRAKAYCGIDARGVSLRRLTLPAGANGDIHRLLRLQIETEFPLPPESLAWGYSRVKSNPGNSPKSDPLLTERRAPALRDQPGATTPRSELPPNGTSDFTVIALKKEVLDDYFQIFSSAGLSPLFTVAALARSEACPRHAKSFAILDVGRTQSELISFAGGSPESLRVLAWGGDSITRAIEQKLGISAEQAEKLKLQNDPLPNGEVGQKLGEAIRDSLTVLARAVGSNFKGETLFLTGRGSRYHELPERLSELIPAFVKCERLECVPDGSTAAVVGLQKWVEQDRELPLVLRSRDVKGVEPRTGATQGPFGWVSGLLGEAREILAQPALRKWARLAFLLCICIIVFPYAQAFLFKPILAKKLKKIRAEAGRLQVIDRELAFMQHLKNAEPPYLDALTVLANSAPPGTRFDSVNLNRRGELALKGMMGNAQQVVDFRAKLIKSAFFSNVTVEEETPSPDRQRMTVRILAQCKPAGARPPVKVEPLPPGFVPGSGMPPGMMPGGPMPVMPGPPMPSGGPPIPGGQGPIVRGPEGVSPGRAAIRSFQSRYGLPTDAAVPTATEVKPVEEKK